MLLYKRSFGAKWGRLVWKTSSRPYTGCSRSKMSQMNLKIKNILRYKCKKVFEFKNVFFFFILVIIHLAHPVPKPLFPTRQVWPVRWVSQVSNEDTEGRLWPSWNQDQTEIGCFRFSECGWNWRKRPIWD